MKISFVRQAAEDRAARAVARRLVSFPSEGPMPVVSSEAELEKLYGKRGVPILDHLGRVIQKELNDDIPDFLKEPIVGSKLADSRKVTLLKDHSLNYPPLYLSIFVQPDPDVRDDEAKFAKMFSRSGCRRAKSVLEADLVVFGGGSDIDPILYGETRHKTTFFDSARDTVDMDLYILCVEQGIPMFGVCRGAQFLHVMNGGKLFQDVDGHYGAHTMYDHRRQKHIQQVSSVHHQMVRPNAEGGMEIIGTSARSSERWLDDTTSFIGENADIEAFFYRDTCSIGVQGHPEYEGYNYFTCWCLELIEDLISGNPDLGWDDDSNHLRVKSDLLRERKLLANLPKEEIKVPAGKKEKK